MSQQSEKEVNDKLDYLFEIEAGRVPDFAILESYSTDHESLVRAETATALLYCFNEQAEQILLRLVRDPQWLVRAEAVDSLRESSSLQVLNQIREISRSDRSMVVRAFAVLSFHDAALAAGVNKTEILSILEQGLKNEKSHFVFYEYYCVMYQLGKKEYLNKLFEGRHEKKHTSRCGVVSRLTEIVNHENAEEIRTFALEWLKKEKIRSVSSRLEELLKQCEAKEREHLGQSI